MDQKLISLCSEGWGCEWRMTAWSGSGDSPLPGCGQPLFHCRERREEQRGDSSLGSLVSGSQFHLWRVHLHDLITSQGPYLWTPMQWGVRISTHKFGENKHAAHDGVKSDFKKEKSTFISAWKEILGSSWFLFTVFSREPPPNSSLVSVLSILPFEGYRASMIAFRSMCSVSWRAASQPLRLSAPEQKQKREF